MSTPSTRDRPARKGMAWPLLIAVVTITTVLLALAALAHSASGTGHWPGYSDMMSGLASSPWAIGRWIAGDLSEVAFYKHEWASAGLLLGAATGHLACRAGHRWQGFRICYGSGLWPWVVTSSLLGLLLSHALWGWTLRSGTWQPTFVAAVSLPAAMVLLFGRGWKVALNGAVLGAVLVTPACLLLVNYVCVPLQLPAVVGNVLGMALGSAVGFSLCRRFPGLVRRPADAPSTVVVAPLPATVHRHGVTWALRRVLADFSEAPFFGNEWASIGLLAGVLLAYAMNPLAPAYGSGLLLPLIAGQALTSLAGVVIWRRQWIAHGWYPTYVPLVSVVPAAVLTYGGGMTVVVSSALLGASIAPPLARALSCRMPSHLHPYLGNVLSMAISTLLIVPLVGSLFSS